MKKIFFLLLKAKEFQADAILTEADKNDDQKSILRKLHKPLRLVLNTKLGNFFSFK